jgi:inner membrane protein
LDSVTQFALGAAVGVAAMRHRTVPWKAAVWGGLLGTLPDLDALIPQGNAILDMTRHRAESHSLFYLSLLSPLLAGIAARLDGGRRSWPRWWLATWLALVTHPLLDLMTVYGTRLLLPFSATPLAVGSIFIIDPLYTLPLLAGLLLSLRDRGEARWRWNAAGLALSTAYLAWSMLAQAQVTRAAEASLREAELAYDRLLVTPAPFNTVLWRLVAVGPDHYHEAYRSLFDKDEKIGWTTHDRCGALIARHFDHPGIREIADFSRGFHRLESADGRLFVTDLRMGQEPFYFFRFDVGGAMPDARPTRAGWDVPTPAGQRPPIGAGLAWLWQRLKGEPAPPLAATTPGSHRCD